MERQEEERDGGRVSERVRRGVAREGWEGWTNCEVFHFDFPRGCMLPRHFSLLFELNAMQF